jgi:hypothetical protein
MQCSFEFRRRIDLRTYRFYPCEPINGQPTWKREDADLWVTKIEGLGWVCIDKEGNICGTPQYTDFNEMEKSPSPSVWISKKGDKSYTYDLIYIDDFDKNTSSL